MQFKEYIIEAEKTCSPLETLEKNNLHFILGMLTEIGELADPFKKNFAYGKDIDWINVKEELFDLIWYIANFCRVNNIDFEAGLDNNIAKLKSRYPNKFTQKDAINRNTKRERKILEEMGY